MEGKKNKTIQSFVGLRGLLLILLIFYHNFTGLLPGGQGVMTFLFVMSGYVLMYNYLENKVRPGPFLLKRLEKLWPPLFFLLAMNLLVLGLFYGKLLPWYRGQALSSLLFFNNIEQIVGRNAYFTQDPTSPLSHLWSISMQVQFYLVWFFFLFKKKTKQRIVSIGFFLAGLSLLSLLLGLVYLFMGKGAEDILLRPEVRFFSLGLGMLFAIYGTIGKGKLDHDHRDMIIGCLMILFILSMFLVQSKAYMAYLDLLVLSLIAGFILLYLSKDDNNFAGFFSTPFLLYLGQRSYSYFLWQYSLSFYAKNILASSHGTGLPAFLVQLPLVILMGELSYRYFEGTRRNKYYSIVPLAILVLTLSTSYFTQAGLTDKEIKAQLGQEKKKERRGDLDQKIGQEEKIKDITTSRPPYKPSKELAASIEQINARFPQYRLNLQDLEKLQDQDGILIGDKTTLDNEEEYARIMPRIQFQADSDRQIHQVIDLVATKAKNLGGRDTPIILQFGTKADFNQESLDQVIKAADGQRLILINVVTPEPWEESVNNKLSQAAKKNKNVFLLDWYGVAKKQSDFFSEDGQTIKTSGQRLMAQMLGQTLLSTHINQEESHKSKDKENLE